MADNVTMNAGTGGAVAATDDVGGVHYQYVKLADGTADSSTKIAAGGGTEATALRVTLATDSTGVVSVDDNGGSLTVDGTVSVTGVATAANQSTIIGHVDGIEGLLTTIDADTSALAGAIAGTEVQVDVVGALPAGTNAIGKLAANTGVDIGDVDVTSVVPGTGATNLGKAEDAAHTSADVGVMALAVRRDADTTLVDTTGDYAPLQVNAAGSLKVAITSGAGSGGTSIADGASFTRDTTSITPAGAVVETSAPTLTNGDVAGLSMTTGGALRVSVASGGIAGIAEDSAAAGGEDGIMMLAVRRDSASSGVSADGDFAALSVTSDGSLRVSGSSGTTQYAEDAVAASGDSGVVMLAVRRDSASSGVSADGDYATLSVTSDGSLRVSGSAGTTQYTEDGASAGAESLCLMGAVRRDTAASSSGTDGDYSTLNTDANGRLHVIAALAASQTLATVTTVSAVTAISNALPAGTNNIGDVDVLTVPADPFGANADAASATGSISAKLRFIASTGIPVTGTVTVGSHAVTNAGTFATQVDGAALTALQLIDNASVADDAAFTPATTGVTVAGFFADETATDSVDEGDAGAARMTLDRKQIVTPYVHAAAGGATPYKNLDCDETEDDIKTSAGKLFWIHVINLANAKRYIKFYNATAANVTVGTTTPVLSFPIPTMGDTNGAGFTISFGAMGVQFDTAISVAATTGFADNDTGAPGANEIILNAGYA